MVAAVGAHRFHPNAVGGRGGRAVGADSAHSGRIVGTWEAPSVSARGRWESCWARGGRVVGALWCRGFVAGSVSAGGGRIVGAQWAHIERTVGPSVWFSGGLGRWWVRGGRLVGRWGGTLWGGHFPPVPVSAPRGCVVGT